MTAAIGLFERMGLPPPWKPATVPVPLVIYGGAGAVGSFAIKLAQAANIHPIIAVAGKSKDYVESLISRDKGDSIVDYRLGPQGIVNGIKKALSAAGVSEVKHAYDAVTEHNSFLNLCMILPPGSKLTLVLPMGDFSSIPPSIETFQSDVASIFKQDTDGVRNRNQDFAFLFFRLFGRGLRSGWLTAHPFEVVPGGLLGVEKGLQDLKAGKNNAYKYVFELDELLSSKI